MTAQHHSKAHFEKTAVIALGQAIGFALAFFIPVYLSRRLAIESYGTYKQIILIQWFCFLTLQMGLDSGLFYFVKREPRRFAVFSLNAVLVEFAIAAGVALLLCAFREPLGHLFHNPELAALVPALGALILFSIPAQHLEHYLMLLDKVRFNVIAFSLSELAKAIAVIGGYAVFHSLKAVVTLLAGVGLLRCLFLVAWNVRRMREQSIPLRSLREALPAQLAFGLPLGLSQVANVFYKLDRFVIAVIFPVRQFTLYSVGALDIPLVPGVSNTMSDLMSFDMVEASARADFARIRYLWLTTKRKIALIQIPIAVYMFTFAAPVITLIYSNRYTESAPYFRLFMVIFWLTTFDCDILFRTFADNRRFMKIQIAASVGGLALTIGGALALGPMGALAGKCVADSIAVITKLALARGLLRVSVRDLLPWGELFKISAASLVSALVAYLIFPHAFVLLSLATYGALFAGIALATGIVKPDERQYLWERAIGAVTKSAS